MYTYNDFRGLSLALIASSATLACHLPANQLARRGHATIKEDQGALPPWTRTGEPPGPISLRGTRLLMPRSDIGPGRSPVGAMGL
jgi:hypothetical protein